MIVVEPAQTPPVLKFRVKAVIVENEDGSGDHFISGRELAELVRSHPEVLAQLGG